MSFPEGWYLAFPCIVALLGSVMSPFLTTNARKTTGDQDNNEGIDIERTWCWSWMQEQEVGAGGDQDASAATLEFAETLGWYPAQSFIWRRKERVVSDCRLEEVKNQVTPDFLTSQAEEQSPQEEALWDEHVWVIALTISCVPKGPFGVLRSSGKQAVTVCGTVPHPKSSSLCAVSSWLLSSLGGQSRQSAGGQHQDQPSLCSLLWPLLQCRECPVCWEVSHCPADLRLHLAYEHWQQLLATCPKAKA